jgi:sporulation protein YlmC with PRC-barrel domain
MMMRAGLTALAVAFGVAVSVNGAAAADKPREVKDRAAFTLATGQVDSKHLIGMKVNTPDGKHVGEIDQLIFNVKDGKLSHAVVGLGGVAGVGERQVVVPWNQVRIQTNRDSKDMAATIDRTVLDSARRYSRDARAVTPAASPATDRDRDGAPNRVDRAPSNPNKQ